MVHPRSRSPGHARTHIGACSSGTNRRAALARLRLDGSSTSDAAQAANKNAGAARLCCRLRHLASVTLALHPCQKTAASSLAPGHRTLPLLAALLRFFAPREGFLSLPSEGYNISKARTTSMADFPLLRKFPLLIRSFHVRCSRTHPHSWERTSSVCIIHLCSVFARPPPFS
jgi:hypothetical protein